MAEESQQQQQQQQIQPKWEGKSFVSLTGPKPNQIWPLLEDFCNLHKWFPNIDTCYQVEGILGQPGLVRYCATNNETLAVISWAKEKLLMINPDEMCLTYEVIDNNIGFGSYVATIKVLPAAGTDESSQIEWSFVADPVKGWRLEDLVMYIDNCLEFMAKKMTEEILCNTN
ncbi:hypothetical protein ACFE04_019016 [Oxalis oulophora]